jgi:trehalose 6-phosphate phosphatase
MSDAAPPPRPDWCFFLDFDGTLAELAGRPDTVAVDGTLADLLDNLRGAAAGAVALVSGRRIAELDRLLAPVRLAAAGLHGAERRTADGRLHAPPPAPAGMPAAARGLAAAAGAHPGLLFEDKGAGLALHFRAAPHLEPVARAAVLKAWRRLATTHEVLHGHKVLEVKPAGAHKGAAVAAFLAEAPFRDRVPLFIGDDLTDEDGFAAAQAAGGEGVKVGAGPTSARYRLADARAVRDWLARWIARRRGDAPASTPPR